MPDTLSSALTLLRRLIATPRVSRSEGAAADLVADFLRARGFAPRREGNNVWALPRAMRPDRPTLLLNAHLDTVRPVASWTRDPHAPDLIGGRLYGLGSNDCGGGLVCLLHIFAELADAAPYSLLPTPLYNMVFLASAEEEVSGRDGIVRALPLLPHIDVALVGEPTGMQPAVAEKGLIVFDGLAEGKSGHAAREEGVNAIYRALDAIAWTRDYRFRRVSQLLGPVKMQTTVVRAGTAHNVVPDRCEWLIDVRPNELYTNGEVADIIARAFAARGCTATPHSLRLTPSHISPDHPLVRRCVALGRTPFGSPTLSDQALMPFPSMKMGPGESARSHTADEYICPDELAEALRLYRLLLTE